VGIKLSDLSPELRRRAHADKRAEIAPSRARRQHQLQGRAAQSAGQDFENAVEDSFFVYRVKSIARLFRMPVPTAPAPNQDQRSCGLRVLSGQAMFDVFGLFVGGGFIGAELKQTAEHKPSLPIIATGMKRGGLQEHQMDALATVAGCGGTARVVWCNGGEIGILREDEIKAAQERFHEGGYGSKSIRWEMFQPPDDWDWLGLRAEKGKP